jgi:pimeloyl-ACP methyl ester carboxylesterase
LFIEIDHRKIHYKWINRCSCTINRHVLVFLHEGLGSIGQWKVFPEQLCSKLQMQGLVYEREGYGQSSFWKEQIPEDYLAIEGQEVLPKLLTKLNIEKYILFGHSDGGTLALYHAAIHPKGLKSMIVEAPHVIIEDFTYQALKQVQGHPDPTFAQRLDKYHYGRASKLIHWWSSYWLRPKFAQWNMVDELQKIDTPALLIQGDQDHFGSFKQLDTVEKYNQNKSEQLRLKECGHIPHLEKKEAVLAASISFLANNKLD